MNNEFYLEVRPRPLEIHVYEGLLVDGKREDSFHTGEVEIGIQKGDAKRCVMDLKELISRLEGIIDILKKRFQNKTNQPEGKEDK